MTDATDPAGGLTHVRADGTAHMVDVSGKAVTARRAAASRPGAPLPGGGGGPAGRYRPQG